MAFELPYLPPDRHDVAATAYYVLAADLVACVRALRTDPSVEDREAIADALHELAFSLEEAGRSPMNERAYAPPRAS